MFKCFEIAKDQYDKLHTCFSGSSAKLVPAGLPEVIEVSNLNLRHLRGRRLTSSWNFSNILLSLPRKHHYLEPDNIIRVSDCTTRKPESQQRLRSWILLQSAKRKHFRSRLSSKKRKKSDHVWLWPAMAAIWTHSNLQKITLDQLLIL